MQVITRVTGNSLGSISNFFIDPDSLRIVSAALRPKGLGLGGTDYGNLLLETFCQIGDVVLVHDESVLDFAPQDDSVGFLDLIGCPVYTSQGDKLGKVAYLFSILLICSPHCIAWCICRTSLTRRTGIQVPEQWHSLQMCILVSVTYFAPCYTEQSTTVKWMFSLLLWYCSGEATGEIQRTVSRFINRL